MISITSEQENDNSLEKDLLVKVFNSFMTYTFSKIEQKLPEIKEKFNEKKVVFKEKIKIWKKNYFG